MATQLYRVHASRRPDGDLRGQSTASRSRPEAATNNEFDVRRDEYGAIDVTFYKIRGQRLRQEAMVQLARSIRKFSLAWLRGWRKSGSRRS
jgi:hypothetical protein